MEVDMRSRADVPWLFMSRRCCPVKGAAGPGKLPQEPGSRGASSIRVELVPCSVPRQKSRASQSPAELGRGSRPPAMPMPMPVPESIPTPGRPAGLVDTIGLRQVPSMSQEKARRLQGWPCLENGQGRRGRNPRSTATHGSYP